MTIYTHPHSPSHKQSPLIAGFPSLTSTVLHLAGSFSLQSHESGRSPGKDGRFNHFGRLQRKLSVGSIWSAHVEEGGRRKVWGHFGKVCGSKNREHEEGLPSSQLPSGSPARGSERPAGLLRASPASPFLRCPCPALLVRVCNGL